MFWCGSFRPLGERKLGIKMEKRVRVTHHILLVHKLICKVNKHVALRLHWLDPHGAAAVDYSMRNIFTLRSFCFQRF